MEDILVNFLNNYGIEIIILAVLNCSLTGIIKMPIKHFASKIEHGEKITKFITFLPVILGFVIVISYFAIFKIELRADSFISTWLTTTSVSLALYALIEKFFPSKRKILQETELKQNLELLKKIKEESEIKFKNKDGKETNEEDIIILKGRSL